MNPTAQCRTEEASHREDILEDPSMWVKKQAPRPKVLGDGLGRNLWERKLGQQGVWGLRGGVLCSLPSLARALAMWVGLVGDTSLRLRSVNLAVCVSYTKANGGKKKKKVSEALLPDSFPFLSFPSFFFSSSFPPSPSHCTSPSFLRRLHRTNFYESQEATVLSSVPLVKTESWKLLLLPLQVIGMEQESHSPYIGESL